MLVAVFVPGVAAAAAAVAATAAAAPQVDMDTAAWDDTIKGWMDPVVKRALGLGVTGAASGGRLAPCLRMLHTGSHVAVHVCTCM